MYYGRSLGEASKACHTLLESTPTSLSAYIKHCLFIVIGVRLVSLVVGIYDIQGAARGWAAFLECVQSEGCIGREGRASHHTISHLPNLNKVPAVMEIKHQTPSHPLITAIYPLFIQLVHNFLGILLPPLSVQKS